MYFVYFRSDVESISTITSVPTSERFVVTMDDLIHERHGDQQDERESIHSGIGTLPESSYAGFEKIQHAASTPNKHPVSFCGNLVINHPISCHEKNEYDMILTIHQYPEN